NLVAQYGALAALEDRAYVKRSQEIIRRNFALIKEIVAGTEGVSIPVEPRYGFSMVIDVSGTGVTAQELTVSLFKRRIAVYPGDGLGDVGAERFVRLNISRPDLRAFNKLREALPEAIAEARNGAYRDAIIDFFSRRKTARAKTILERIKGGS
ncbi:MAG: hypothetical protein KJ002_04745, partial [Candidatus Dadabacteria bacterium]|nr:hypothetical protein [Candidatus Dadabacteria bacterium]